MIVQQTKTGYWAHIGPPIALRCTPGGIAQQLGYVIC